MKVEGKVWIDKKWVDSSEKMSIVKNRISGIYSIEIPELKVAYIGQSINIKSRWAQHKHVLKLNKCEIKEFQDFWNKHENKFEFKIIEETVDNLKLKEMYYAEEYVKNGFSLFNRYFLIAHTNLIIDEKYKSLFTKIMKLHTNGRLDIDQMMNYLDGL